MALDNTQLLKVVNSYSCFPEYKEMLSFFSDAKNSQAILDAQTYYGSLPPSNTQSYHTGFGVFGSWHDFCDREPMGKFYQFAKLSLTYPTYSSTDQSNCQKIKDALASLNTGLTNVNENNANVKKSIISAYNDKIAQYTTLYSTLTCDNYLTNQAQAAQVSQSINNGLNVISGGNTIVKYALGAGILVVGFMIIKRVINGKAK